MPVTASLKTPTLPTRKRDTLSKRDLVYLLSRHSQVAKHEVLAVLDALELVMTAAVDPAGPGLFTLPGWPVEGHNPNGARETQATPQEQSDR